MTHNRKLKTTTGWVYFQLDDEGVVWVHDRTTNFGGWRITTFGTTFDAEWTKRWAEARGGTVVVEDS